MTQSRSPALDAEALRVEAVRQSHDQQLSQSIAANPVFASTYRLSGAVDSAALQYGRFDNPTWQALEQQLTHLEGGESVLFPSGMAAVAAVFFSQLQQGDKILLPSDGYYASRALLENFLSPLGVQVVTLPTLAIAEAALEDFRLVFVESPSNPLLDVLDIAALAERCQLANCLLAVDNTTLTPLGQQPLTLGADISVCSDTKALNGHSDVVFGHVASRDDAISARIRQWRTLSGSIPGPMETWLVQRGLATLDLRLERMCGTAQMIAERLHAHRAVKCVRYPGLPTDPSYSLAKQQQHMFGFIVSFELASEAVAQQFLTTLSPIIEATSFGGVHSMAERRARWGTDDVAPGLIRLSVGCEQPQVLWQAIAQALAATE
ncbi:MAG: cystathionine gamma-lyase [Gammaproteobacteria bacterium]|nr:cystathionine gamma-lyase [Gammaproteobacteria bacterium]